MRVLIDACLPVELKDCLPGLEVRTAREMGWQNKTNGELLTLAQQEFDVLLTMDKSIPSQQKLSKYSIAVVILRARSNRLADLLPLISRIMVLLPSLKKGAAAVVAA